MGLSEGCRAHVEVDTLPWALAGAAAQPAAASPHRAIDAGVGPDVYRCGARRSSITATGSFCYGASRTGFWLKLSRLPVARTIPQSTVKRGGSWRQPPAEVVCVSI